MPDDTKKPSGTLTLKPRAPRQDDASTADRVRSGARARRVEQMTRVHGEPAAPPQTETPPSESRPPRQRQAAGERAPAAGERPYKQKPAGARPERDGNPRSRPSERAESSRPRRDGPRQESAREDAPHRDRPRYQASGNRPNADETTRRDRPPSGDSHPANTTRAEHPRATPERRARPGTRQIAATDGTFQVFTPCPQGLETALAEELQALGFNASPIRAGCHVQADWHGVQRINLFSRLATRVLVKLSSAQIETEDDILDLAKATPWERWFGPEHSLRVDTSAVRSPMKSLHYCNLRAKDGICDRLREREGARPDIDTVRPDARVHLFLDERSATLYLDTSGESLFKRGWRLDKGEAPIRENLAAGMLALSGWTGEHALLDPFCGSGTILIEAAWKAMGMPPGIMRPFAFERLRHHDRQAWYAYKDQMRDQARQTALTAPLVGVELDPANVAAARANAARAGLGSGQIQFQAGDACEVLPPADTGWIVTNPPYGERLANDDPELWSRWASHLKRHFSGWQVHAISNDLRLPQQMRLQAKRRYPLHNGALDCRLFSFDMVSERYEGKSPSESHPAGESAAPTE